MSMLESLAIIMYFVLVEHCVCSVSVSVQVLLPCVQVSRAHILNKATEYIRQMQRGGSLREVGVFCVGRKTSFSGVHHVCLSVLDACNSIALWLPPTIRTLGWVPTNTDGN